MVVKMSGDFSSFDEVVKAMKEPIDPSIEQFLPPYWIQLRKKLSCVEVDQDGKGNVE